MNRFYVTRGLIFLNPYLRYIHCVSILQPYIHGENKHRRSKSIESSTEEMANFRGAPARYGFFHSVSPPMSGGFMDQVPRQMKGEEEESSLSQNLWVGNLSADVTESMLMDTFAKFGEIDNITVYPQRNYAFVYFKHIEQAIGAKEGLQGTSLCGSIIKIDFCRAAKPSRHLWVGGISQAVTKEQLEAEFLKFGRLEDFKLHHDRMSAFVEYSDLDDAVSAVKFLNGKQFGGDSLRVDYLRSQQVKRESVTNSLMHTIEKRNGYQRTFMASTDLGRRNFEMLICPAEPPQGILPKLQTAHGHDGGRNQGGQTNILCIDFPPSVKIDEQRLHNALILFGEIERIRSFPSRHHALVEFRSVDEARRAKDGLQGRLFNDPRIQILYSNSEFMPVEGTKDSATLTTPLRGMLPPDTLYRSGSQFSSIEGLRPINPSNSRGINMHARPVGPWRFHEQNTARTEPYQKFLDANINSPRPSGSWNRPPSLIAPGLRPLGPLPGVQDGFDGNTLLRESKRPRVNESYPVAGHSDIRKLDNDAPEAFPGYYGTQPDRINSNYINTRSSEDIMGFRENQGSPVNHSNEGVAGPGRMQPPPSSARAGNSGGNEDSYEVVDEDQAWQGIIAKGGTPVCRARCIPIGRGIDAKLPEVVNCSARTGLDKLAEHFSQASDFGLVCFLPSSSQDGHTYQEFLYYLGSKHRAGVAKFSDGTTLFLVPPSDFSQNCLKVRGTDRLFGVVLKFHQLLNNSMYQNQSIRLPHEPSQQLVQRQHFPISQVDHGTVVFKEDQTEYNTDVHRPFSPLQMGPSATLQSTSELSAPQSTVNLTPELIATINALTNAFQASGSGSGSLVQASLMKQDTYGYNGRSDASNNSWQASSPKSSEIWRQHQQPPPLPSHQLIPEQGPYQQPIQLTYQSSFSPVVTFSMPSSINTSERSGHRVEANPPLQDHNSMVHQSSIIYQTTANEVAHMASDPGKSTVPHNEQLAMACGQEMYQQETPLNSQTSYAQMISTGTSENIQSLVSQLSPQQKTMASRLSDQYHAGVGSQILPNMQVGHNGMSSELSSQVQQLQGIGSSLLGNNQEISESEAEKNQRYQSTLQFAANLLQQLQQKQAANNNAVGGTQHRQ